MNRWEKTGVFVAAIFLAIYWTEVITHFKTGNPYAHKNYWGQDIGTFSLAAICFLGTIALVVVCWRHWFLNSQPGKALVGRFANEDSAD